MGYLSLTGEEQVQSEGQLAAGAEVAVSPTVEFVLGNRLICRAQTTRQISRTTRATLLQRSNAVPTTGGLATVCNAEIPTRGCNFTRSALQSSLVRYTLLSSSPPPAPLCIAHI